MSPPPLRQGCFCQARLPGGQESQNPAQVADNELEMPETEVGEGWEFREIPGIRRKIPGIIRGTVPRIFSTVPDRRPTVPRHRRKIPHRRQKHPRKEVTTPRNFPAAVGKHRAEPGTFLRKRRLFHRRGGKSAEKGSDALLSAPFPPLRCSLDQHLSCGSAEPTDCEPFSLTPASPAGRGGTPSTPVAILLAAWQPNNSSRG
jgi:hypothetical protein